LQAESLRQRRARPERHTKLFRGRQSAFSGSIGNISFAGGQLSFNVSGQAGPDYEIQTSTNLSQWNNVFIPNSPTLPFVWTDTNLTAPQRFYRIKLGPPLP